MVWTSSISTTRKPLTLFRIRDLWILVTIWFTWQESNDYHIIFKVFLKVFHVLMYTMPNTDIWPTTSSLHENICLLIHYLWHCAKLPNLKVIDGWVQAYKCAWHILNCSAWWRYRWRIVLSRWITFIAYQTQQLRDLEELDSSGTLATTGPAMVIKIKCNPD